MTLHEPTLFAALRKAPFRGRMNQGQVDGVKLLLATAERERVTDVRQVANILAQVFHETATRMQPIKETVMPSHKDTKPTDATVIARLDKAYAAGKLGKVKTVYWRGGWFGRGHIQLTHKANYERAKKELGVDLVGHPGLALDPDTSARVAVIGMRDGWFTTKRLGDYFSATKNDPLNARRIVNGTDEAKKIADLHEQFLVALASARAAAPAAQSRPQVVAPPADTSRDPPAPAAVPAGERAHDIDVFAVQRALKATGYHDVGIIDGKPGGATYGAVTAFRLDRGLPPGGIDQPLVDELGRATMAGWTRPITAARAEATPAEVQERAPEAKAAATSSSWTGWQTVSASIAAAFWGAFDNIGWAKETLGPVRDLITDIPPWAWAVLVAGVSYAAWRKSRQAEAATVDAYRTGERK